jgi:hypothetical protein
MPLFTFFWIRKKGLTRMLPKAAGIQKKFAMIQNEKEKGTALERWEQRQAGVNVK